MFTENQKTSKKEIGVDFIHKIDTRWYENAAESHIDGWKSRYSTYKTKKDVEFDLNVNHDPSLEIEYAETVLDRKLTIDEEKVLVNKFNKFVVKNINLRQIRQTTKP